jgi:hypothetical protein
LILTRDYIGKFFTNYDRDRNFYPAMLAWIVHPSLFTEKYLRSTTPTSFRISNYGFHALLLLDFCTEYEVEFAIFLCGDFHVIIQEVEARGRLRLLNVASL